VVVASSTMRTSRASRCSLHRPDILPWPWPGREDGKGSERLYTLGAAAVGCSWKGSQTLGGTRRRKKIWLGIICLPPAMETGTVYCVHVHENHRPRSPSVADLVLQLPMGTSLVVRISAYQKWAGLFSLELTATERAILTRPSQTKALRPAETVRLDIGRDAMPPPR
jgi:hypothetical protein